MKSIVAEKSYSFALKIVQLYKHLVENLGTGSRNQESGISQRKSGEFLPIRVGLSTCSEWKIQAMFDFLQSIQPENYGCMVSSQRGTLQSSTFFYVEADESSPHRNGRAQCPDSSRCAHSLGEGGNTGEISITIAVQPRSHYN